MLHSAIPAPARGGVGARTQGQAMHCLRAVLSWCVCPEGRAVQETLVATGSCCLCFAFTYGVVSEEKRIELLLVLNLSAVSLSHTHTHRTAF